MALEFRWLKENSNSDLVRLQYRDDFKKVTDEGTTECVWADVPVYDSETGKTKNCVELKTKSPPAQRIFRVIRKEKK